MQKASTTSDWMQCCSRCLLHSGALYTLLPLLKEYVLQNTVPQIEDINPTNVIYKLEIELEPLLPLQYMDYTNTQLINCFCQTLAHFKPSVWIFCIQHNSNHENHQFQIFKLLAIVLIAGDLCAFHFIQSVHWSFLLNTQQLKGVILLYFLHCSTTHSSIILPVLLFWS